MTNRNGPSTHDRTHLWPFLLIGLIVFSLTAACTPTTPPAQNTSPVHPSTQQFPRHAAIASAHPLATAAGFDTLARGGNAFDAAITVAAVLSVVEPYSAGMGGGGFWLLQRPNERALVIDARETAPAALTTRYFMTGETFDRDKAVNGPLAAGIPGQPAALAYLAKQYGKLPLRTTLEQAIEYAKKGFTVDAIYRQRCLARLDALQRYPASAVFLSNGQVPAEGERITQPHLANTLRALAQQGHHGFYSGKIAEQLVDSVRKAGGVWQTSDLTNYHIKRRAPLIGTYHNLTITTAPPPSAGGIVLLNMLNALESYDLNALTETDRIHLTVETMRRAYQLRATALGDPDFVDVPVAHFIDKSFAHRRMANFAWDKATPSIVATPSQEGNHTTHFSILDTAGNRVSATLSINLGFGSAFVAEGTGILLNNELDDFTLDINGENAYGLTGNQANALEPGKRPLSSMSPTFIESADWFGILGTPGGSRITTMVLLGILEAANETAPEAWVTRPRYHHQFLPDRIDFEPRAWNPVLDAGLRRRGHVIRILPHDYGNMQAILWTHRKGNEVRAASDPRRIGRAIVADPRQWRKITTFTDSSPCPAHAYACNPDTGRTSP